MRVAKLAIPPTENEHKIFRTLIGVNDTFGLKCTLRVAGGWVRDRLLGHESNDIDIALEGVHEGIPMTGSVYSNFVARYQTQHGLEASHIGTIKANPDQSKHLETATMQICGIDIDFVNLRCEEYATSRIPIMRPGTPAEDASRRDLTINSLFYNIHTSSVEDFTSGLTDLEDHVIRTPLPPLMTFFDDPLRLLRCVRFACRFQFEIHPAILEASKDEKIHRALRDKVSRSRVGIEITKILSSRSAVRALELFHEFGIEKIVFEECSFSKKGQLISSKPVDFTPSQWVESLKIIKNLNSDDLELNLTAIVAPYLSEIATGELDKKLQGILTNGLSISSQYASFSFVILRAIRILPNDFWDSPIELDIPHTVDNYPKDIASVNPKRLALCEMMQLAIEKVDKNKTRELWEQSLLISAALNDVDIDDAHLLITRIKKDKYLSTVPTLTPIHRGNELTVCVLLLLIFFIGRVRIKRTKKATPTTQKLLNLPVGPTIKTYLQRQFIFQSQVKSPSGDDVLAFLKAH